jgi:hypothetical protein
VHPVFLGQAPVAERVLSGVFLDTSAVRAPWLSLPEPLAMRHPQFQRDVAAFAADLRGTGNIAPGRADSIARVAVREAYHRRIPPALVLGVMLTENDRFKPNARSKVGALGLMQIMPHLWTPNLGPILGHNLRDDETNLRYGVYILRHFARNTADTLDAAAVIRTALLGYNGCVKGTNTPRCHTYPSKVKSFVENQATSICDGRGFYECIAKPFIQGLFGDGSKDSSRVATQASGRVVQSSGGAIASPAPAAQPAAPSTPAPAAPTASTTPSSAATKAAVATTTRLAAKRPKAGKAPAAKARTASRKAGPGSARSSGRSSARTAESSRPKSAAPSAPKPIDLSKIRVP